MKTVQLSVSDMSCGHCVTTVESALSVVEGVEDVEVSLDEKSARVRADENVDEDRLVDAVRRAGYEASVQG